MGAGEPSGAGAHRLGWPLVERGPPQRAWRKGVSSPIMGSMSEPRESVGGRGYRLGELTCEACGAQAALFAAGWRADRPSEPYPDELPALAFYCPDCAAPELDASGPR